MEINTGICLQNSTQKFLCVYLIDKHASLGWFVVQWEDVQVSSGGETRLHHRNQGVLRNACDLKSNNQKSVTFQSFFKPSLFVFLCKAHCKLCFYNIPLP